MRIDRMSGRTFLRLVTQRNELKRAERNYLLAKAAAQRRRSELADAREEGRDTASLERMLALLERAIEGHREIILKRGAGTLSPQHPGAFE